MKKTDIKDYLRQYPSFRKWINECSACHILGYKPEMPEHIGGEYSFAGEIIRKELKPMEVDELGFCTICSRMR